MRTCTEIEQNMASPVTVPGIESTFSSLLVFFACFVQFLSVLDAVNK